MRVTILISSEGLVAVQEDTYAAEVPLDGTYGEAMFGLYDGHGGAEVARFSALHMVRIPKLGGSFTLQQMVCNS